MMTAWKRRLLALSLTVCMLFGSTTVAFADQVDGTDGDEAAVLLMETETETESETQPAQTEAVMEDQPETEPVTTPTPDQDSESQPETKPETTPEKETTSEKETNPDKETKPEKETKPQKETEPKKEHESDKESDKETEKETQKESETKKETETETETESETESESETTNEEIKNENLSISLQFSEQAAPVSDFRFWTILPQYAFAKKEIKIYQDMKTKKVAISGKIKKNGLMYVLAEGNDGWYYVESGDVRGFVKADEIHYEDKEAKKLLAQYTAKAQEESKKSGEDCSIEDLLPMAKQAVAIEDNAAYAWCRATVKQTVIKKEYALVTAAQLDVLDAMSEDAAVVGTMKKKDLCYVIEAVDDAWLYIESGDVRGFVPAESIDMSKRTAKDVVIAGEDTYDTAVQTVKPVENAALYYTLTSVRIGAPDGDVRTSSAALARQYVGYPYVKDGSNLMTGTDDIHFIQNIYAAYGYQLPAKVEKMAKEGTEIPVTAMDAGDLVILKKGSGLGQTAICVGKGKIVYAKNEKSGIVEEAVSKQNVAKVIRLFDIKKYVYVNGQPVELGEASEMIWPLEGGKNLSCGFGVRVCPFHGKEMHNGVDLPAASGTPVMAAADGVVVKAGKHSSLGNFVVVCHANGYCTWYLHNSELAVTEGQRVKQGDVVSYVGMTGTATGPHLDFRTMRYDGTYEDPTIVIK